MGEFWRTYLAFIQLMLISNLAQIHSLPTSNCLLACSQSLRSSISSLLLTPSTSAFSAPFHTIIEESENMQTTYRKARQACYGASSFDLCLRKCQDSFEKSALLLSLGHWTTFCDILKEDTNTVLNYFSCERGYLREAKRSCGEMEVPSRPTLGAFCRAFDKYRNCYAMQPHNCTGNSLHMKEKVDDSVLVTFEKLLKMSSNRVRIPPKCTTIRHHRLRHHNKPNEHRQTNNQNIQTTITVDRKSADLSVSARFEENTKSSKTLPTPTLRAVEETQRMPRLKQINDHSNSFEVRDAIPLATEPQKTVSSPIYPTYHHYQSQIVDSKSTMKTRPPKAPNPTSTIGKQQSLIGQNCNNSYVSSFSFIKMLLLINVSILFITYLI